MRAARVIVALAVAASTMVLVTAAPAAADGCDAGDGGYRLVSASVVQGFGDAATCIEEEVFFDGPIRPVTGVADDPHRLGEWLVVSNAAASNVSNIFRSVPFVPTTAALVGIAPTPTGHGAWIVDSEGATFAYGDARYRGGTNTLPLEAEIVDLASAPRGGQGYWQVSADGGVFTFGAAQFFGSLGALTLAAPIVDLVPTPTGEGYWLVASDGGVFAFGDARFFGSAASLPLTAPVVGMAATEDGDGYWLLGADGGVFAFGAAEFLGRPTGSLPAGDAWFGIVS